MEARILAAHGEVHVVTDSAGITFQIAGRTVHCDWDQITGAGLATHTGGGVTFPVDSIELPGGVGCRSRSSRSAENSLV